MHSGLKTGPAIADMTAALKEHLSYFGRIDQVIVASADHGCTNNRSTSTRTGARPVQARKTDEGRILQYH
jgi:hypothetical protein